MRSHLPSERRIFEEVDIIGHQGKVAHENTIPAEVPTQIALAHKVPNEISAEISDKDSYSSEE